jgi:hypothetical protein
LAVIGSAVFGKIKEAGIVRDLRSRETISAMRYALLLVLLTNCRRPMKPGETRCYSTPAGNSYVTNCKTAPLATEPAVAQPITAPERPIVYGADPIYCMSPVGNTKVGSCYFDKDKCDRLRVEMSVKFQMTECEPLTYAACYSFRWTMSGKQDLACSPSVASCEASLADDRRDPDRSVTATQCDVYRVRG